MNFAHLYPGNFCNPLAMSIYNVAKPTEEAKSYCHTCSKVAYDTAVRSCPRKFCDARTVLGKCDKKAISDLSARQREANERAAREAQSYAASYAQLLGGTKVSLPLPAGPEIPHDDGA